jgi:hypothetical protein
VTNPVRLAGSGRDRYAHGVLRHGLVLMLATAVLTAACGGPGPTGPGASSPAGSSAAASPTPSAATESGAPSDTPGPSDGPSGSAEPTGSAQPSPSPSPSPSGSGGPADACTGTQSNRNFFVDAARAVTWPVRCAVLPDGWFVTSPSEYRLAGGGKLRVSYKGPSGATVALSEGAFCTDPGGCVPAGTDAGEASLGTAAGTFIRLGDGGFAVVVDRGLPVSWLLVVEGLDETTARSIAAAVVVVAP